MGDAAHYYDRAGNDDIQPGNFLRLCDAAQRERLFGKIARHMSSVLSDIRMRQIGPFFGLSQPTAQAWRGCWRSMTQKQPRIPTYLNEDRG